MEKLSHAYIVSSASEEVGLARATELAAEILCSGTGKKPCGVCRDCRKVRTGVHPDLGFVRRPSDDKGNKKRDIQVDQIRDMGADAYILPNEASGKVYIIEEAETMNESAQNAALKLFEEPPAGVHFILCTANPEKLLITVRSRCAMIRCNNGSEPENREMAELADVLNIEAAKKRDETIKENNYEKKAKSQKKIEELTEKLEDAKRNEASIKSQMKNGWKRLKRMEFSACIRKK